MRIIMLNIVPVRCIQTRYSVFWFENQSFECDKLYYWAQIYSFSYNYSHPGLLDDILMDQSNSRSIYSDFASISVKDARQICNVQMWRDWQYEEETGMEVEGWRCNLDWVSFRLKLFLTVFA